MSEVPSTVDEFMALALAMEKAAAERYEELADTMQVHNNAETAELFRRMAAIEIGHAREIQASIGDDAAIRAAADAELPELASPESLHYLMLPWHALSIALDNERRAERFFADLAMAATSEAVRETALRLCAEEREHAALIEAWLARASPPGPDWSLDPDPPRYTE